MTEATLVAPVHALPVEENALHESALIVERDDRRRWTIAGPQTVAVLNGLVTNDITKLAPGLGCYAAALTAKGKVVADLRVFARADDFLIDTSGAAGTGWADVLRKYVNPRFAKYTEVTGDTASLTAAGPGAAALVAGTLGVDRAVLEELAPHAHLTLELSGPAHIVARTPEPGVPAYDVIVAGDDRARVFGALTEAGGVPGSLSTWEAARIAHGWPAWGRDMDGNTLAQEASLDAFGAISFDKGCYTGQETVARIHFRGHVNRFLRRARYVAGEAVPGGAALENGAGKVVGDVRSSAISPREGGVAIVMVRREVPDGALVTARWNNRTAGVELLSQAG